MTDGQRDNVRRGWGSAPKIRCRVLHVTNWYPNPWEPLEGIFVKDQVDLFATVTESHVANVQVRPGHRLISFSHKKYGSNAEGYYLFTRLRSGRVTEILTTLLLLYVLARHRVNRYDFLQIHIAYPLLSFFCLWKPFVKPRILVSEHWSAYFFNFWLPTTSKGAARIRRVFHHRIPVIAVSKALVRDVQAFSRRDDFQTFVLPNVIDTETFCLDRRRPNSGVPQLFVVNVWREIKNPFPFLEALVDLKVEGVVFYVVIGGFGPLLSRMREFVVDAGLSGHVCFAGKMTKAEIAQTLSESDAYIFSSIYETFSLACAQALCCGTPLIGPEIPAIMEYADPSVHVAVTKSDAAGWKAAIREFLRRRPEFDRHKIAEDAHRVFSQKELVANYQDVLDAVRRG